MIRLESKWNRPFLPTEHEEEGNPGVISYSYQYATVLVQTYYEVHMQSQNLFAAELLMSISVEVTSP